MHAPHTPPPITSGINKQKQFGSLGLLEIHGLKKEHQNNLFKKHLFVYKPNDLQSTCAVCPRLFKIFKARLEYGIRILQLPSHTYRMRIVSLKAATLQRTFRWILNWKIATSGSLLMQAIMAGLIRLTRTTGKTGIGFVNRNGVTVPATACLTLKSM